MAATAQQPGVRGLSSEEAARRLVQHGPNELRRRGGRRWPGEIAHQLVHPLALLLWAASGLALVAGIVPVAIAIVAVIVVNAAFAFIQEQQAERAVEALTEYLPARATAIRDGHRTTVDVRDLVPGDVIVLEEGDRVSADAQLVSGSLEVDLSTLTGESAPAYRDAEHEDPAIPRLQARNLVFSGTTCTEGEAMGLVVATGMHTELGRIAALSERVVQEMSPLERQVRRVAWLIAAIAVVSGAAFIPIAVVLAGLSLRNSVVFAIGILVGNVPEGLLPVITLALAVGVRGLVRRGVLVKRLSAVETLGSTDVICTDKTGTLTENRMRVTWLWTPDEGERRLDSTKLEDVGHGEAELARSMAACTTAYIDGPEPQGDPTELAVLEAATQLGAATAGEVRDRARLRAFHFDPSLKRMSTISTRADDRWIDVKGAPEAILPLCTTVGADTPLDDERRAAVTAAVEARAGAGLRVMAVAARRLDEEAPIPAQRSEAETGLSLLGLVAMLDPPRPEVASAVARCHDAGIRIIVVTGDHGLTASAVAHDVGITGPAPRVVTGEELDAMDSDGLRALLAGEAELIFARSSPEAKLRIAEALRTLGHTVAMTGDGVNDAPALRAADIGVAMGRTGTEVAREAATMVLTDDNFASIVAAVEAGRRVYDNIRKFILYIFAHATPEVVPFLVFAVSGGAIPLPLTVLQLLSFDVGTETLPALALGQEPAEPGIMARPPRSRREGVVTREMLVRAWLFLGALCALLQMIGFFLVLRDGGWHLGDPVGPGSPLHDVYRQATTMSFVGMVAGQIGTAFAARTERASLWSVGVFSNPMLLWGIAFEIALTAVLVYVPVMHDILGTAALSPAQLAIVLPFPFIVWGSDEIRRWMVRRHAAGSPTAG